MISPMKVHAGASAFGVVCALFMGARLAGALIQGTASTIDFAPVPFNVSLEAKPSEDAARTLAVLSNPVELALPKRNLFVEWQPPVKEEVAITLDTVEVKGLPIFYQGMMKVDESSFIAQINYRGRSYFPTVGEKIDGWEVLSINAEELKLKNPQGEEMVFPYRGKLVKNEDLYAVITMGPDNQVFNVKVGDVVKDYTVQDIKDNSVTLIKDGKAMRLEAGKKMMISKTEPSDERTSEPE